MAQGIVLSFANDPEVSLSLYSGAEWLVPRLDRRVLDEAAIIGFTPIVRPDLSYVGEVEKILLMTDEHAAAMLADIVAEDDRMTVTRSKPATSRLPR